MVSSVTVQNNETLRKVRPGNKGKCIKESNNHDPSQVLMVDVMGILNYLFQMDPMGIGELQVSLITNQEVFLLHTKD